MIYICGPMTGLPGNNYDAFGQWAQTLRAYGYEVANPAENPECPSWEHYMRLSMVQLAQCEGVALLSGWEKSRGASLEVYVATQLGIEIRPAGEWVS
jgi:hypothetical protein